MSKNMSKEEIVEIIKNRLQQAEKDLKDCPRGRNWGAAIVLRELAEEIGLR